MHNSLDYLDKKYSSDLKLAFHFFALKAEHFVKKKTGYFSSKSYLEGELQGFLDLVSNNFNENGFQRSFPSYIEHYRFFRKKLIAKGVDVSNSDSKFCYLTKSLNASPVMPKILELNI